MNADDTVKQPTVLTQVRERVVAGTLTGAALGGVVGILSFKPWSNEQTFGGSFIFGMAFGLLTAFIISLLLAYPMRNRPILPTLRWLSICSLIIPVILAVMPIEAVYGLGWVGGVLGFVIGLFFLPKQADSQASRIR